jgi:arginase
MRVQIFAVPYDTGHRDVRMGRGPARLLERGFESVWTSRGCDTATEWIEVNPAGAGDVRTSFELYGILAKRVGAAHSEHRFPIVLAGNCGSTIGAVAGLRDLQPAVVWFDAHADFNTPETSPSGFLDGMGLAILTGRCWRPLAASIPGFEPIPDERVALVGARDLDPPEREALDASGVAQIGADLAGIDELFPDSTSVWLHVDLDALDAAEGRANQFATGGGLSVAQLVDAVRRLASRLPIAGLAFTSYDPTADTDGRVGDAALKVSDTLAERLTTSSRRPAAKSG